MSNSISGKLRLSLIIFFHLSKFSNFDSHSSTIAFIPNKTILFELKNSGM